MADIQETNYKRIAEAIAYIRENFKRQPGLNEVAEKVNLSPFHFQRIFTEWAGVSPKKFLQYTSVEHLKSLLQDKTITLFDAAYEAGLSGTGRLHDLFVSIEGMTPGEYKNAGAGLTINYSFAGSPFGNILIASTHKGICYMAFSEDESKSLADLEARFQNATFKQQIDAIQQNALHIFSDDWNTLSQVKLHLRGTEFQLKVWETLLRIPLGTLVSYGTIAQQIDKPSASRAVGTAIGSNPIAFLIPCHRVIQSGGALGGYMWGLPRKSAMIGWESARTLQNQ